MTKLRVAVIGVGHLGYHHARIFSGLPGVDLVGVADSTASRCAEVAARFGVPGYEDYRHLVRQVDAVSIVVPTLAHAEVAAAFLAAGKSVLVEKPLTADVDEADRLVALANRHGTILQVGHIERFNPVLNALPRPGVPPRLIEMHRAGPYSFRSTDIGVVFDLMIHDLDLALWLTGETPEQVSAAAWTVFGGHEDVASARLTFPGGTVAQLTASRAGITPRRTASVWWSDACAELDFAAHRSVTSLATPEFHAERGRFLRAAPHEIASLREGMKGRYFQVSERDWSGGPDALTLELEQFVASVRTGCQPLVGGREGQSAVRLAAQVLAAARAPAPSALPPQSLPFPKAA